MAYLLQRFVCYINLLSYIDKYECNQCKCGNCKDLDKTNFDFLRVVIAKIVGLRREFKVVKAIVVHKTMFIGYMDIKMDIM